MPTAVLRRYTPPTCTLEIAATGSALSRWTDRTVLKDLRFHLSFDDPTRAPDQQVSINGDRTQLEVLCEVVGSYVQNLLSASPTRIKWEAPLRSGQAQAQLADAGEPVAVQAEPMGISLQPQGLLSHDLRLGKLATEESGAVVHLTALQLFDLANALEEYHAEALSLPASGHLAWLKAPKWASAAAVAVLALGATGAIAKFVMDISTPTLQTASAPRERQVNSELNRELFPALSPPPLEPSPSITLEPLPPPPPTKGTAQSNNPGLPPVGVTQAPPQPAAPAVVPLPSPSAATSSEQQVTLIPNPETTATAPAGSTAKASTPPRLESTTPEATSRSVPFGAAADGNGTSNGTNGSTTSSTTAANNSTAFDTIPQVAEIRSYFQQKWQPPEGLNDTLQYRLLLNANGSLQRIVPLGQASENYLDRTNMPLMGETFVSATNNGSTPQIRLVLKPNGQVQTFLEYAR